MAYSIMVILLIAHINFKLTKEDSVMINDKPISTGQPPNATKHYSVNATMGTTIECSIASYHLPDT